MAAPKGNKYWQERRDHGRKKIYETPQALWEAFIDYCEWIEKNPLYAAELVKYQGRHKVAKVPVMRAMTETDFVEHSLIGLSTWKDYCSGAEAYNDFSAITTRIKENIRNQKFQGAAADLLNANIIARDLGLADKTEGSHTVTHVISEDPVETEEEWEEKHCQ